MASKNQHFDVLEEPRVRVDRPRDALALILKKAMELGLDDLAEDGGVRFTVGTMCSGTDAPILALRELQDAALAMGYNTIFDFDHTFSVEIEAFKQAFIERNSKPSGEIYRDVVQVSDPDRQDATTAHGSLAPIPAAPDLLVAGSSCVDFSKLNTRRDIMEEHSVVATQFKKADNDRLNNSFGTVTPRSQSQEVGTALRDLRNRFDTEGESAKTFISVLQYVYDRRPKVVILENVSHAPWFAFANFWLPLVGYIARSAKVDSKNFLVPQTRSRGYLVAIDQWHYGTDMAMRMVHLWSSMMDSSNWYPNQYPEVHKFLLPPMDQRILEARAIEERKIAENMNRDVEARMCAFDHAKVRRQQGLGSGRPFTQRDGRGNLLPRDTSWQAYIRGSAGRVQDLLDITWLSERKAGRDLNHKAKYLDLGEGVERLKSQIGIVGCVLPDGDLFATDQGRPLLGIEALSLQGLPIDRIHTSVEKQAELHDMAGNAMTTTVVGAGILSILIAERQVTRSSNFQLGLPRLDNENAANDLKQLFAVRQSSRNGTTDEVPAVLQHCPTYSTWKAPAAVSQLVAILEKGRRYCPCAGYRKHHPATGLMRCTLCLEVRCVTCAGNPAHAFEMLRIEPTWTDDITLDALRRMLPGRFSLSGCEDYALDGEAIRSLALSLHATEDKHDDIVSRLHDLRECLEAVYYLDRLDISQVIVATYVSTCGRVELSIGEHHIVWYLYVRLPLEPVSFKQHAAPPIARAILDKLSSTFVPNRHDWEVYFIQPLPVAISFENQSGSVIRCSVTEFNGRSIDSYPNIPTAAAELMTNVDGVYEFSQKCGTPFDLLYSRRPNDNGSPLTPSYIFLDTKLTTAPEDDRWVISQCVQKLNPDTHREVLCTFPQSWETHEKELRQDGVSKTVQCEILGLWLKVCKNDGTIASIDMSGVDLTSNGIATDIPEDLHVALPGSFAFLDVNQAPVPVLQLRIGIPDLPFPVRLLPQLWKTNGEIFKQCARGIAPGESWMRVNDHHHKDALALISFALGALKADHLPEELKSGLLEGAGAAFQTLDAAFPSPKIHLLWEKPKVKKLFDEPRTAQTLGESYKKRPLPLELDFQLVEANHSRLAGSLYSDRREGNTTRYPELIARVLFNPTALAHRAWLHLPREGLMRGIQRNVKHDGHVGFAVNAEFVDPSLKMIESFETCLSKDNESPGADTSAVKLPSFELNDVQLRPDQTQSVSWMIEQESSKASFVEKEVEEFLVPSTSIRLRSHAEVANRARGGVLAHDVGFGKTIATLALIDHQRKQNEERSVAERHEWTQYRHCHLKATLIVCPPQIVNQWHDEIRKFLGFKNWKVMTINAKTQFRRTQLEEADIIILSTAFTQSSLFTQSLRNLTGTTGFCDASNASPREFNIWYREALDSLEDSCQHYAANNRDNQALEKHIASSIEAREKESKRVRASFMKDSRRKDQKKRATTGKSRASISRKKPERAAAAAASEFPASDSDTDERKRKIPSLGIANEFQDATSLQMYSFDRVVLDEFSYENKSTAAFITHCVASSKWILSGTPPMADLGQVCAIADLVNIHVARPEASVPMSFPSITRGPKLDRVTKGEEVRQYADPKSAQFALERHEQACAFIQQKMTRRETDTSRIGVNEQVVVSRLDPVSAVTYAQLQQVLYDSRWDIEEVSGDMRVIIEWHLHQTGNNRASKARENLRMSWHNTIQSLLVQSSSNLSAYGENMSKLGMNVKTGLTSGVSVLASMLQAYQALQDRSKAMIKSQFDMLMYVVDQVQKSGIPTGPCNTSKDKTKQDKAKYYQEHLEDFIQKFTAEKPLCFGDNDEGLGATQSTDVWQPGKWSSWKGGNGTHSALDWWKLTAQDVDAMDEDELKHMEDVLIRLNVTYGNGKKNKAGGLRLKASICEMLDAGVLSRYREAETEKVVTSIGLASKKFLAAYWEDTAKSRDFEFGNRFRSYRPTLGGEESDRGTTHDQATNRMAMSLQSIQAGMEEYVRQARRLRVLSTVHDLFKFAQETEAGEQPPAPACDVCDSQDYTEMKDLSIFITCGHLLCSKCAAKFEAQHQDENTSNGPQCLVDSCSSMGRSALIPCDQLISAAAASTLDFEGMSAKVAKILEVIRSDVKGEEKVLLFVSNQKLKAQLFKALEEGNSFDAYMTNGTQYDSDAIQNFKQPNRDGRKSVLVQSLMSEESAGTNLTAANHVMFAAPLHTDTRNHYMYMRQARGRAIRYGQTRPVKVYHFVTAHTMEVDVLEHRLKHKLLFAEGSDRMPLDNLDRELYAHDSHVTARGPMPAAPDNSAACPPLTELKRIRPYIDEVESRKLLDSQEYDEWQDRLETPPRAVVQQAPAGRT